jgi:uncharacterized protein YebE (UPF0316 family)
MEHYFTSTLGISEGVFSYLVLPLLIFCARIMDVSINTIRIIYVLGGRKGIATFLGFFESLIWLLAISQIFEHLDNWVCYIAYPGGFACGILVGMMIEERIASGKVIVRIITSKDINELLTFLNGRDFRFTHVNTIGPNGQENLVFTVLPREQLEELLNKLKELIPTAFFTVEKVNRASDNFLSVNNESRSVLSWLRGVRRE